MSQFQYSQAGVKRTTKKKRSITWIICTTFLAVALMIFSGFCILMLFGFNQVDQSPQRIEVGKTPDYKGKGYILSAAQSALTKEIGWPTSFAILFYTVEGEDGSPINIRDETWTYYGRQKSFQFINGTLSAQEPLPMEAPKALPIPYKPEQFSVDMNLDEVIASSRLQQYLQIPLETELVPKSRLYYAKMLTFALQDNKLRYVETLALEKGDQP